MIQGGTVYHASGSATSVKITLPKKFKSSNYYSNVSVVFGYGATHSTGYNKKNESSFTVDFTASECQMSWVAIGIPE